MEENEIRKIMFGLFNSSRKLIKYNIKKVFYTTRICNALLWMHQRLRGMNLCICIKESSVNAMHVIIVNKYISKLDWNYLSLPVFMLQLKRSFVCNFNYMIFLTSTCLSNIINGLINCHIVDWKR